MKETREVIHWGVRRPDGQVLSAQATMDGSRPWTEETARHHVDSLNKRDSGGWAVLRKTVTITDHGWQNAP